MKAKARAEKLNLSRLASPLGFAILGVVLCLLASGIAGRALWCDEILRINGQGMSVAQLMRFEHLKTFCTQTTAAYLFMRPWQALFGMETGGFIVSALAGGAITFSALLSISLLFGKRRLHPVASLLVATNPLLIYYGSELAFYGMWAAAAAAAFALHVRLLTLDEDELRACRWLSAGLVLAGTAVVAFHFAGIFVWSFIAAVALACVWHAAGLRKALAFIPVHAIPALVNLPMYIGSMRAPEHIGTKTLQLDRLGTLIPALWGYVHRLFPALTGGRCLGVALAVVGAVALLRASARSRRVLAVALASTVAILPFLAYSHLREYMPVVARYWVCALAPTLALVGVGAHFLLVEVRQLPLRVVGWALAVAVLCANSLVAAALIDADGRPQPYRRMQQYMAGLPPVRNLVFVNHYESRFFGGYYALPNRGRAMFPSIWEEGEEARVNGLKAIWKLVPDAVCYANDRDVGVELKQAGIVPSRMGFVWKPSRLMLAAYRFKLHPEPPVEAEKPLFLLHETQQTLAEAAERNGTPVVVPSPGWMLVGFRDPQGAMRFGLIAQGPIYPGLQVYIPKSAGPGHEWRLGVDLLSYMNVTVESRIEGRAPGVSHVVRKTAAESFFIPQRKGFAGLPSPDDWVRMGHQLAIVASPASVTLQLGILAPGWHEVAFDAGRKVAPLVLTAHRAW
ncbi:MAG: hypothetical protein ACOX9C_07845 [Kiritimatiellia bacterium]|jgi:hypothetical protein